MRTFPSYVDGAAITWLVAIGYVVALAVAFVLYTWISGFVVRRRAVHRQVEVHEVPRGPQIRKVA